MKSSNRKWLVTLALGVVLSVFAPQQALADDPPVCQTPVVGGYAEVFGTVTNDRATDGVLALRGFDNRANTFGLSNVALSAQFRCGDVSRGWGRVGLDVTTQWGLTPNTYYAAEPTYTARDGVGDSGAPTWRFIQQAVLSWRRDLNAAGDRYWQLEGGLFPSPIGPEGFAVKDNWNWSRSNLFYGLPFYHTGARLTRGLGPWRFMVMALNGWNSVIDNNDEKTAQIQAVYEVANHPDLVRTDHDRCRALCG